MSLFLSALLLAPTAGSAPAGADAVGMVERGRAVYAACAACHEPGGATQTGPDLRGVLGRPAASVSGFRYSRALRRSGLNWDESALDRFVADPQALVPGTTMPYAGEPDPEARAALVAYLKTLRLAPP
jgi:cytochrome c